MSDFKAKMHQIQFRLGLRRRQIRFDSIRFDSIDYFCVTRGWGHLWTVVCIVKRTRKIINSYLFGISRKCTV